MRFLRHLATTWRRARQRQALGSRRFAESSRLTLFRLFAGQLAASAQAWCVQRAVHLTGLGLALMIVGWGTGLIALPDLSAHMEQAIQEQADYEDGLLCAKFGFAPGTQEYFSCKLDLADLRRRDEQLQAAYELP